MRAVDTNVLIYAYRQEPRQHEVALKLLREASTGIEPWAIPWPCIYEFLRVVTHPKSFSPPSPVSDAWEAVEGLLDSPSVVVLHEGAQHQAILKKVLRESGVRGNLIHDAHIAALLIEHGVEEIVTADDDFRRFTALRVTNPFRGI